MLSLSPHLLSQEKFPPAILPADQQCGAHSSQGEAIPTKEGAEPPQGNAFPPQDRIYIYPPQSGAYPLQGGAYPLQGGVCPPQGGAYPPQGGVYPQQGDSYPRQGDANPQQGGAYPPQGGAYAPQGGAYPSQGDSYMPQGNSYPPQGDANPQQGGAYAPQGGAYPPQGGAYPSQGGAYPPQGGAYPEYPPQLGGVRPGFNGSPPYYPQATPQQQTNVVIVQPKSTAPVRTKVGDYGYILSIVFTIICLFGGSWLSLCCTIPAIFVASSIVRLVKIEFSKLLAERTSRNSVESQSQGKIVRRLSKKLRVSSNRKLPNSYNSDFMSMRPSSPVLLTRGHHFGTILEDAEGQEPYIAPLEYTPSCSCMDMKPDYLKEKHSLSYEIWLHFGKSGKRQVRSGKDRSHISYYRKIHGKPLEGGELVWLWSSAIQDDEVTARRFTGIGKGLAYQILKSSLM
eukprot:Em0003g1608a